MKKLIPLLFLTITIISCNSKNESFLISKQKVGLITDSTRVKDLQTIFKNDSIAKTTEGAGAFEAYDEYTIYDKHKQPLLLIVPIQANNPEAKIRQVEILSDKYKTNKGITIQSDFGNLKKVHKIGKFEKSLKYIVVFIDDLNATIAIKKTDLPLNVQNNPVIQIDETFIPDNTHFKHFIVFIN